jgi:hypothetical protein
VTYTPTASLRDRGMKLEDLVDEASAQAAFALHKARLPWLWPLLRGNPETISRRIELRPEPLAMSVMKARRTLADLAMGGQVFSLDEDVSAVEDGCDLILWEYATRLYDAANDNLDHLAMLSNLGFDIHHSLTVGGSIRAGRAYVMTKGFLEEAAERLFERTKEPREIEISYILNWDLTPKEVLETWDEPYPWFEFEIKPSTATGTPRLYSPWMDAAIAANDQVSRA